MKHEIILFQLDFNLKFPLFRRLLQFLSDFKGILFFKIKKSMYYYYLESL